MVENEDTLNRQLLREAQEWILAHPKHFDPEVYYTDTTVSLPAIVAVRQGWVLVEDWEKDPGFVWKDGKKAHVVDIASAALGVFGASTRIFDPEEWPERYAKSYATAVRRRRPKERAEATAKLLQAVIEGKVILSNLCRLA